MTDRPYRILVTGSRDWSDAFLIRGALTDAWRSAGSPPAVVVHGACATGADQHAAEWAWARRTLSDPIHEEPHPAQGHPAEDFGPWPAAGPRRNAHMVNLGADRCLAFIGRCAKPNCHQLRPHGSHSASGTADLVRRAGIPVQLWTAP
ncbi:SLOG family protein [Streptomyces virginiae]